MDAQRTLKRSISCAGIGLHSGKKVNLSLKPAPANTGIRFRRTDLGGIEIPARATHVGAVAYATQLKSGEATVETVEHLLAALASARIDNAIIELNTREVPIMDGSSAPFVYLLQEAGVKVLAEPRRYLKVMRPISLSKGDKQIALYPSDQFKVTYTIGFDHPLLRHQSRAITVTEHSFAEEIAPARTFTFLKEVEMLRQNGLALGGSLDNAIVVGDTGVLNSSLRFEDEFVRHKILDLDRRPLAGRPPGRRARRRDAWRPRPAHRDGVAVAGRDRMPGSWSRRRRTCRRRRRPCRCGRRARQTSRHARARAIAPFRFPTRSRAAEPLRSRLALLSLPRIARRAFGASAAAEIGRMSVHRLRTARVTRWTVDRGLELLRPDPDSLRWPDPERQSARSAVIGSTRDARSAGT